MGWCDFLNENKGMLLSKIESSGEENLEFYKGVLVKDDESYRNVDRRDVPNATMGVHVEGRKNKYQQGGIDKETHALWINLWSKETGELEGIEEIIKDSKKWQCAGEGIYIGDNLNEGLVLNFTCEIDFNWTGYSLDGQNNIPTFGNHTIPFPEDGSHTIQVFANDSLGKFDLTIN